MDKYLIKYWPFMIASALTFMLPLIDVFLFVGGLVVSDFITGVVKAVKEKNVTSHRMIDKFYTSTGYFIGLLIARACEVYFGTTDIIPFVKIATAGIGLAELQSIRENIKAISGVDVLKPIVQIFKRKVDESNS